MSYRIFISYAREDEDRAKDLAVALEHEGWEVFWDRTIPVGRSWRDHIGEALNKADCIIVAWSRTSITSHWVIEEADEARKRGVLFPVLFEVVDQPLGFRHIQAADLTTWETGASSEALDRLMQDIRARSGSSSLHAATSSPSRSSALDSRERQKKRPQDSQTPQQWYAMGIALYESGKGYIDPYRAIDCFTEAIGLDPGNANTYHARGIAFREMGQFVKAVEDFNKAIGLYSGDAEYFNERCATYWAMQEKAKARMDWQEACSMGSQIACNNLRDFR